MKEGSSGTSGRNGVASTRGAANDYSGVAGQIAGGSWIMAKRGGKATGKAVPKADLKAAGKATGKAARKQALDPAGRRARKPGVDAGGKEGWKRAGKAGGGAVKKAVFRPKSGEYQLPYR